MTELIEQNPHILGQFLNLSGTSIVLLTDEGYRLTFCNDSLIKKMHLSEKPLRMHLKSILCPLEDDELSLVVSSGPDSFTPQLFKLCNTDNIYRCYSFNNNGGYLILGDMLGSTENEMLENMSSLNNKLSAVSRELSKKNSELEQANSKITQLARTDYLTGLANRGHFQERFHETFALTKRHSLELSIILADLDHFKRINDSYGHDVGDRVLQTFGSILKDASRKEDVPARYGGEEFIVMLPKTSATGAEAIGERWRSELSHQDLPVPEAVTFSAGIAEYADGDTETSLLKKADDALYEAKESGRDRFIVYRA